jgi:hypothetical protein
MFEQSNDTAFWVLGTNFLTAYLTIYDADQSSIGFVKNFYIDLPKPVVVDQTNYTSVLAGAIIGGVALIVIVAFVVYFCCRKQKFEEPTAKIEVEVV